MTKERALILAALQQPMVTWRTLGGICRDTGLSPGVVESILVNWEDEVVIEHQDQTFYASRSHLIPRLTCWDRLRGAFRNRIC